jgi:hypothetical protein
MLILINYIKYFKEINELKTSLENANKKIEGILLFINIIIYYILNTHYNFNLKRNEQINE